MVYLTCHGKRIITVMTDFLKRRGVKAIVGSQSGPWCIGLSPLYSCMSFLSKHGWPPVLNKRGLLPSPLLFCAFIMSFTVKRYAACGLCCSPITEHLMKQDNLQNSVHLTFSVPVVASFSSRRCTPSLCLLKCQRDRGSVWWLPGNLIIPYPLNIFAGHILPLQEVSFPQKLKNCLCNVILISEYYKTSPASSQKLK